MALERPYKEGMGILDRMSTLIKSNLNAAIDKMTDPGKEIDQLILDMEEQLKRARGEVRTTLATEKVSRHKVGELELAIADWEAKAEQAVRAGDDELAREALKRRGDMEAAKQRAEQTLGEQTAYADQLTQALKQLEERLSEVKGRKETLKAKARASKGQSPLGSSAFNEFERLAGKIDVVDAEAELDEELRAARHEDAKSLEAEKKLENLGKDRELEDRLAALKEKLKK